jgi:hypothetical protein
MTDYNYDFIKQGGHNMGIQFSGYYTLQINQTLRVWQTFSDPNAGPVFLEPREFIGSTRGNTLTVTDYSTIRNSNNSMAYRIDIKNEGPQTASFEIMLGLFSY